MCNNHTYYMDCIQSWLAEIISAMWDGDAVCGVAALKLQGPQINPDTGLLSLSGLACPIKGVFPPWPPVFPGKALEPPLLWPGQSAYWNWLNKYQTWMMLYYIIVPFQWQLRKVCVHNYETRESKYYVENWAAYCIKANKICDSSLFLLDFYWF